MVRRALAALALVCACAPPVSAQTMQAPAGNSVPVQGQCYGAIGAAVTCVDANHPLPTADAANLPFAGAAAMTVGTVYTPQRSIGANCTAAGTAALTMSDGSSMTVALGVGWQSFPFAAKAIASTTATCSFYELK